MKTIGSFLKEARVKKKYTLEAVERETKIKREFIKAIEKGQWESLPEFPVVLGFVKNIASFLEVDPKHAAAFLRRDYPPKVLSINPKPDAMKKFEWSPRLTFFVAVGIILALILGYLGTQYIKFISPPFLEVLEPKEKQEVSVGSIKIVGRTSPGASVKVNNQTALVFEDGKFEAEIEILEGTTEIIVQAASRSGKETTVRRTIKLKLDN